MTRSPRRSGEIVFVQLAFARVIQRRLWVAAQRVARDGDQQLRPVRAKRRTGDIVPRVRPACMLRMCVCVCVCRYADCVIHTQRYLL